jgi:hypothetical protein
MLGPDELIAGHPCHDVLAHPLHEEDGAAKDDAEAADSIALLQVVPWEGPKDFRSTPLTNNAPATRGELPPTLESTLLALLNRHSHRLAATNSAAWEILRTAASWTMPPRDLCYTALPQVSYASGADVKLCCSWTPDYFC